MNGPSDAGNTPASFVEPAYGSRSLTDVLPAVAAALGTPLPGAVTSLHLPDAGSYVVFLVDGLGAELIRRYAHAAPFLASLLAQQEPGTAGVPSTTVTSLTSLGTGLLPGTHGMVGYTARIPGTDRLLNGLNWSGDVDPLVWQPHTTAFMRLGEQGVLTTVVNKAEFMNSPLTTMSNRGAEYVGAQSAGERIAAVVGASWRSPSLTYVYDSALDSTGHRHGVASQEWLQQLSAVDSEAEQMRDHLPPGTRLLVIADHGMVDSPQESRIDVDDRRELRDGVRLLGGEARFRHVYCHDGAVDDVAATWREVLGDRAEVLTRAEAGARGWFGALTDPVADRIGDVVAACAGDAAIMSSVDFPVETRLVGMHGSLSRAEMLIPMLVI
ncbi:alkaline phosphatase family protein [Nocardioides yefusunii]|uniref:Alkaline phosphatase family protein n=1 Tax=Nocardioides yefusunii TaxID=2500546 RepID=A0ABW1QUL8_9ACTN|nr:nucleotide pyrophosphatase/phosphodiesterase family protein [Nocardioides yefusunii]